MKDQILFRFSLMVAGYFALLLMNTCWFKSNSAVFSFFQESLTIPMLVFQGLLWGIAVYKTVLRRAVSRWVVASMLLLTGTSVFTYGSLLGIIKIS